MSSRDIKESSALDQRGISFNNDTVSLVRGFMQARSKLIREMEQTKWLKWGVSAAIGFSILAGGGLIASAVTFDKTHSLAADIGWKTSLPIMVLCAIITAGVLLKKRSIVRKADDLLAKSIFTFFYSELQKSANQDQELIGQMLRNWEQHWSGTVANEDGNQELKCRNLGGFILNYAVENSNFPLAFVKDIFQQVITKTQVLENEIGSTTSQDGNLPYGSLNS